MSRHIFPETVLQHHVAALGKTRSGKTSTAKLLVEQVVAEGGRVCILDPIKSDWWGLTSSADGKKPGLPFSILGGPRKHVGLPATAGTAIGELVGSGQLPLSILDMADFGAGDHQRFFVDFAAAVFKRMRGVLHLVIEEAHEFAPKERSGMGAENMAVYWAKRLATGAGSKGIRLVVATQRVQALHNAVLGSCESMIVHRLTAPADQKPVVDWLKANAPRDAASQVQASLASLPTGTGWVCSGEAQLFEKRSFPRIATFDNSATPTADAGDIAVKTAPVDQAKLQAILGAAAAEAAANDPAALKERVKKLEGELRARASAAAAAPVAGASKEEMAAAERRGYEMGNQAGFAAAMGQAQRAAGVALGRLQNGIGTLIEAAQQGLEQAAALQVTVCPPSVARKAETVYALGEVAKAAAGRLQPPTTDSDDRRIQPVQKRILDALAELEQIGARDPKRELLAFMAGYTHVRSKGFSNALSSLSSAGLVAYSDGGVGLTPAGREIASASGAPRTPQELQARIVEMLGGATSRILKPLIDVYPRNLDRWQLAETAGYGHVRSKGFTNGMSRLRSLGFIEYKPGGLVVAQPVLFA